jgi:hypothetical protein
MDLFAHTAIGTTAPSSRDQDQGPRMPRWYFEKKELRQTPSVLAGMDPEVESRYRREGKSTYVVVFGLIKLD